jgi:hypothetical protein
MRVAVNLVIEVDVQSYRDEYGDDYTADEIRDMLRNDILETISWEFGSRFDYARSVELR